MVSVYLVTVRVQCGQERYGIGYGMVQEEYGSGGVRYMVGYGWTLVRCSRTWVLYSPTCV